MNPAPTTRASDELLNKALHHPARAYDRRVFQEMLQCRAPENKAVVTQVRRALVHRHYIDEIRIDGPAPDNTAVDDQRPVSG